MFDVIALLVSGLAGALGWFFAWRSRGEAMAAVSEEEKARAGESAATTQAFVANARATAAEAQAAVASERALALQAQLDNERRQRQALVDALAKAGVPAGDILVGGAIGVLYPDGGGSGQDSGPNPGDGRSTQPMPAVPPRTA